MCHFGKAGRGAVTYFGEAGQMRITAELEDEHHEHEERHEEVQAVQLCNAAEHEGDDRDDSVRVAELACKKEAGEYVEDARCKCRSIYNGHNPLVVGHVVEGARRTQMQHYNVNACEQTKTI